MHPNSGDHRGVPTFDQNLKSQLKHFLTAVAVATNLAQQAIIASTRSLQQARHSCYLCLHLRKQEVQTLDTTLWTLVLLLLFDRGKGFGLGQGWFKVPGAGPMQQSQPG